MTIDIVCVAVYLIAMVCFLFWYLYQVNDTD